MVALAAGYSPTKFSSDARQYLNNITPIALTTEWFAVRTLSEVRAALIPSEAVLSELADQNLYPLSLHGHISARVKNLKLWPDPNPPKPLVAVTREGLGPSGRFEPAALVIFDFLTVFTTTHGLRVLCEDRSKLTEVSLNGLQGAVNANAKGPEYTGAARAYLNGPVSAPIEQGGMSKTWAAGLIGVGLLAILGAGVGQFLPARQNPAPAGQDPVPLQPSSAPKPSGPDEVLAELRPPPPVQSRLRSIVAKFTEHADPLVKVQLKKGISLESVADDYRAAYFLLRAHTLAKQDLQENIAAKKSTLPRGVTQRLTGIRRDVTALKKDLRSILGVQHEFSANEFVVACEVDLVKPDDLVRVLFKDGTGVSLKFEDLSTLRHDEDPPDAGAVILGPIPTGGRTPFRFPRFVRGESDLDGSTISVRLEGVEKILRMDKK